MAKAKGSVMDINLSGVTDPFDPAARGRYTLQFDRAEETLSKENKERMIRLQMSITDAADKGNREHIGKNVFEYLMLEGKGAKGGLWRLRQYVEALGLPLEGRSVDVELEVQPGEGSYGPSNRVSTVYPK